jgi:hypothetical protein
MSMASTPNQSDVARTAAKAGLCVLGLCVAGVGVGGCAMGPRERYFSERAAVVHPVPGDGAQRYAAWPTQGATRAAMVSGEPGRASDLLPIGE